MAHELADARLLTVDGYGHIALANPSSCVAKAEDSYFVTVHDANLCSTQSSAVNVTVNPLPAPSITASGATTFCAGGNVTLTANATGATSYQWSLNGNPIGAANGTTYTATASGNYNTLLLTCIYQHFSLDLPKSLFSIFHQYFSSRHPHPFGKQIISIKKIPSQYPGYFLANSRFS